jgi:hypothetical protein
VSPKSGHRFSDQLTPKNKRREPEKRMLVFGSRKKEKAARGRPFEFHDRSDQRE